VIVVRWEVWVILIGILTLEACRQATDPPQSASQIPATGGPPAVAQPAPAEMPPDGTGPAAESSNASAAESATIYYVYAGSYATRQRAQEVVGELAGLAYSAELVGMEDVVHVRIASCDSYENAVEMRSELMRSGYPGAFATRLRSGSISAGDSASAGTASPADSTPAADEERLDAGQEAKSPEEPPASEPEDHDNHWWEGQLDDPGCVLMTWDECLQVLATNGEKRAEFQQELSDLRETLDCRQHLVYVGSYRDRDQAELAAARAARHGISLEVQPGDVGGWIAAAELDNEVDAARLHRQLDDAGLPNNARWEPAAAQLRRVSALQAELRELDRQDSAVRSYMTCFNY